MMMMMMRPMLIHSKSTVSGIMAKHDSGVYTGVLFRFGEVSANGTMVRLGANIYASGDAIFLEHSYPEATAFSPVGRVKKYYVEDDRLLIDFVIDTPEGRAAIESGKKFLSVSWFSNDYEVKRSTSGYVTEFNSITIYEVSLVGDPAFNTCIAAVGSPLPCIASNSGSCKCGCAAKESKFVSLSDMVAKHQEVTREEFDALKESIQQLSGAIAILTEKVNALEQKMAADPTKELSTQLEQAKRQIEDIVATLNSKDSTIASLLAMIEKLIVANERIHKTLPNLLQK
jgi:BMFP domain-containing protein YqiC